MLHELDERTDWIIILVCSKDHQKFWNADQNNWVDDMYVATTYLSYSAGCWALQDIPEDKTDKQHFIRHMVASRKTHQKYLDGMI